MKFENPQNGYVEEVSGVTWFWCLLFGGFYFAFKGIWIHFVIGLIAAFFTWGLSWLIYPFFARSIVINHFQKNGWREVSGSEPDNRVVLPSATVAKFVEPSKRVVYKANEPLSATIDSPVSEDFWSGDRNLNAATYKIYLSEKYHIQKNELFGKFVYGDAMFDTIDEAVTQADKLDREREVEHQGKVADFEAKISEQKRQGQSVVERGNIGPEQKFTFERLASGEVIVGHHTGVSKRFSDLTLAKIFLRSYGTEGQALLALEYQSRK